MCGIVGIIAFNEKGRDKIQCLNSAVSELKLRGPDGNGTFFHENAGLGHTRLSIIDTSNLSAQPFTDRTGRFTIVYNGEIFNFKKLREDLVSQGMIFISEGDTEVLLNLYIREKEKCLSRLNGFFAFCIYDKLDGSIFIARDRYGIKPISYYLDEDKFLFGSEVKAIEKFSPELEIDHSSILNFLQFNYIPSPATIYKKIKKLEPGHFLRVSGKKIIIEKYYELPGSKSRDVTENPENKLFELLDNSIKLRLVSDVPLGAFLSGGLDSSIITALAARHQPNLKTFSIGFKNEPYFDETKYSNLVAQKYKTDHTVFSLTNDDLIENLFKMLDYMEEPFADSSSLPFYVLSSKTSKMVKVALSGDGADEIFGGYNKHRAEFLARKGGVINTMVSAGKPIWKYFPKSRNSKFANTIRQLDRFANGLQLNYKDRYWNWAAFQSEASSLDFINERKVDPDYYIQKQNILKNLDPVDFNSVLRTEFGMVLKNDMLVKVDRMSMSNSLEIRVPYLDFRLVDYMFSLPASFKIDKHHQKILLKKTFGHLLPSELITRKKQGFEVPLLRWLQKDLKTLLDKYLNEERIRDQGIFNYTMIDGIRRKLNSPNPGESASVLWGQLCFQYWWEKHIN